MNKLLYFFLFLFGSLFLSAQESASAEILKEPEMADVFRSEGKIYVVIAVLAITFLCLIGYLIYIDVKLRKLEKKK